MRAGLIGYLYSGRTTLFEAVAMGNRSGDLAFVPVSDTRLDALCKVIQPKKCTPSTLELMDNAATMPEKGVQRKSNFAAEAKRVDVLVHVVREFDSPCVPFHSEPNPKRDIKAVETELILADLQLVESRLERLSKSHESKSPGTKEYLERVLLENVKPHLETGRPLRDLELREDEIEILRSHQMLSLKPMVVAINCAESELAGPPEAGIRICAEIEREIASIDPEERAPFLADLGISKPATQSLTKAVYEALGLITFFTARQKETKAWPLKRGSSALNAAAVVHTDIARGFIRAEVVSYADFVRLGSIKACYDADLMRLEGKEYVVQDGDIINIRNKS